MNQFPIYVQNILPETDVYMQRAESDNCNNDIDKKTAMMMLKDSQSEK